VWPQFSPLLFSPNEAHSSLGNQSNPGARRWRSFASKKVPEPRQVVQRDRFESVTLNCQDPLAEASAKSRMLEQSKNRE
jgi:hypothetical protein